MGLSQYQICCLMMLFANSHFIWPRWIASLMQLQHFSCKTLHVPENRAGLSCLRHQKARGDKRQHCPHKALLVATLTKAPHFGEGFGKHPTEMCWQTAGEDAASSPDVPAPWKSQCIFQFRGYPSSPNFFPSLPPAFSHFFLQEKKGTSSFLLYFS